MMYFLASFLLGSMTLLGFIIGESLFNGHGVIVGFIFAFVGICIYFLIKVANGGMNSNGSNFDSDSGGSCCSGD